MECLKERCSNYRKGVWCSSECRSFRYSVKAARSVVTREVEVQVLVPEPCTSGRSVNAPAS